MADTLMAAIHQWPSPQLAGLTRRETMDRLLMLGSRTRATDAMASALSKQLMAYATRSPAELAIDLKGQQQADDFDPVTPQIAAAGRVLDKVEPGRFAELKSKYRPMVFAGNCLAPFVTDRTVCWVDSITPPRPGDMVVFAAKGVIFIEAKLYLATIERDGVPSAVFWQAKPEFLWEIPLACLLHVDRVAVVQKSDKLTNPPTIGGDYAMSTQITHAISAQHIGGTLPKGTRLLAGWNEALLDIHALLHATPTKRSAAA